MGACAYLKSGMCLCRDNSTTIQVLEEKKLSSIKIIEKNLVPNDTSAIVK